jgi:hypothetical protein
MTVERTDRLATRLTGQIDELGRSLARAGVPLEEQARLLEAAAVAAMRAVTLEATTTPEPPESERAEPAPVTPIAAKRKLRDVA